MNVVPEPTWYGLPADIWLSIATIIAVILGPIAALYIQGKRDEKKEHMARKTDIFRKLFITRAVAFSPVHIDSLNLIEVEFDSRKKPDKPVVDKWHEYWEHLNTNQGSTPEEQKIWLDVRMKLLVDLLWEMGNHLNKGITRAVLEHVSYYPTYFGNMENENMELRQSSLQVFKGERPLKVVVYAPPAEPAANLEPPKVK
jgi:hypothetical protein